MCEVLQKKQVTLETMVKLPDGSTEKQLVPINFRKLLLSRFESPSLIVQDASLNLPISIVFNDRRKKPTSAVIVG